MAYRVAHTLRDITVIFITTNPIDILNSPLQCHILNKFTVFILILVYLRQYERWHYRFTPNITTTEMKSIKKDENFNYVLMCNKICGGAHYKMKMMVVVLEKNDYDAWMNGVWKDMDNDGKKDLVKRGKIHESTFAHSYYDLPVTPTYSELNAPAEPENDSEDADAAANNEAVVEENEPGAENVPA